MKRSEALRLRTIIEQMSETLDDYTASIAPMLFSSLKQDGKLVKYGSRINWHGVIKRAKVDMWDMAENTPDAAPDLWEDIMYREGIRIIPETITAGTSFGEGEQGWWEDVLYRSKIAANVWTPAQYPDGWEVVDE